MDESRLCFKTVAITRAAIAITGDTDRVHATTAMGRCSKANGTMISVSVGVKCDSQMVPSITDSSF